MKALGRFSKRFYLKQIIICIQVYLLVVLGPLCGSSALATPNNPNVVLGSTEPITTGNTTTVNLISEKAVINWQGLNTADGQRLEFDKSGASGAFFAVLNRVTSGSATQFNGALEGHGGHVIIVNPQGIVFGSTAVINAFKFTASGLGINSTDYTNWYNGSAGQLKFTSGSGAVTNNGAITAQQVNLIGKSVTNNGTIRTTNPDGLVVMAAGDKVYLAESGSSVVVDTGSSAGDNVVRNTGTIDAPGGGILLAAGDIFSQAAIEDAESFVAEADRDITISESINAESFTATAERNLNMNGSSLNNVSGNVNLSSKESLTIDSPMNIGGNLNLSADLDLTINGELTVSGDALLYADADHTLPGDFQSTAPITAGGNIEVKGNDVLFEEPVYAGGNLTIKGRDCYETPEWPWGNVTAMKTLDAEGDITISVTGTKEIATWVPSGKCGGGHWEYSTDYEPGTINLFGDVAAGRDLALYNITNTGPGVTLMASNDIRLEYAEGHELETTPPSFCEYLTGDTWLALRAGNEIKAPETIISVTGSTLIMEQGLSINLDNFNFDNQENTNLMLISIDGSVTAVDTGTKPENAADKWNTIGATAQTDITLSGPGSIRSGDSGTDTSKSLWAINGDIDVDAGGGFSADKDIEAGSDVTVMAGDNILLMGNVTAGQNITLTATEDVEAQGDLTSGENVEISSSDTTTYLHGDVTAGSDIILHNNTWAADGIKLDAAQDISTADGKTLTGEGALTVEADRHITLGGAVAASDDVDGDLALWADKDGDSVGNMTAYGTIHNPGGSIDIYSSDNTTYLGGDWVVASDNITLHNKTVLNGGADQKIDAENGTVHTYGTVAKTTSGQMSILAADGITLEDAAMAEDSMNLDADTDHDGIGDMLANSTLTTTNGDIEISASDTTIKLQDNVSAGQDLILNSNTEVAAGKKLDAGRDVTVATDKTLKGKGALTVEADRHITLGGAVTASDDVDGDLVLWADKNADNVGDMTAYGTINNPGGSITATASNILLMADVTAGQNITLTAAEDAEARGNLTAGENVEISSSDDTTYLGGNVTAGSDIILHNNTEVAAGKKLDAGRDVTVATDKTLKGKGALTVEADRHITLGGAVTASDEVDGDLVLWADKNADNDGDMTAYGTIHNPGGSIDIYSSDNTTYLGGDWVVASDNITLHNKTVLNGGTDQRIDAEAGALWAKNTITKTGAGNLNLGGQTGINLDGTVDVDAGSLTIEDDFTAAGDLTASDNVTLNGAGTLDGTSDQKIDAENGTLWAKSTITKTGAGNLNLGGQTGINLDGTVDVDAGSLTIEDDFTAAGDLLASDNITLNGAGTLDGTADQTIEAENGTVHTYGTIAKTTPGQMSILSADGITLEDAAMAEDSMNLDADTDEDGLGDMWAQSTLTTTNGDIEISASDSTIILGDNVSAGEDLILNNNTEIAADKELEAGQDVVLADSKTLTGNGNLTVRAGRDIWLGGEVTTLDNGNMTISANPASGSSNVFAYGKLTSGGDMLVEAGDDVYLKATPDSAYSGEDMIIIASAYDGEGGNLEVSGNLEAEGDITLSSSDDTTYLGGNVFAGDDILLNNNTIVNGSGTQTLEAGDNLTAMGYVRKCTEGDMYLVGNSQGESEISVDLRYSDDGPGTSTYQGNLWILGKENIQISDDVTTFGEGRVDCEKRVLLSELPEKTGGVAIISENGKIYTEGGENDTLNVSVTGSSDELAGTGVYGFGLYTDGGEPTILSETEGDEALAAIAIVSAEPLKITGELSAQGQYYDGVDYGVDNRPSIGFLDVDAEIPAGVPRDPGKMFDLAIYTASRTGSVEIDCPVTIASSTISLPTIVLSDVTELQPGAAGAMVVDAYDIVKLGEQFKESLAAGAVGDRLEVASRITEWLEDAVGRLSFPEDLDLPENYNYVMRGAGLENPEITDGRAWVLESKVQPFGEAAPIQEPVGLKLTGCPALMNWVAGELGVSAEQVQILFSSARGYTYDVQPCDTCARLQGAARILTDSDGSRIAALARVVNEYAAAGVPPSEEQMALIAAAMENPEEGSDFALASEWLDAMTEYVSILHNNFGLAAEDAVATAVKYVSPVTEGDNAAVAVYVSARLSEIGG